MNFSDLKLGSLLNINGQPHQIVWQNHVHTGRGKAVLQAKLKNIITGKVLQENFKPGDKIEEAEIQRRKAQFLYKEKNECQFMLTDTFETVSLSLEKMEDQDKYLKEDSVSQLLFFKGQPVKLELPVKMSLKVVSTVPGVKGDTATGGNKPATLETGLVVQVPLFIKKGDQVRINTETGEYSERV